MRPGRFSAHYQKLVNHLNKSAYRARQLESELLEMAVRDDDHLDTYVRFGAITDDLLAIRRQLLLLAELKGVSIDRKGMPR